MVFKMVTNSKYQFISEASMVKNMNSATILQTPLKLPCGAVIKNRIAKSPMSDSLSDGGGNPTVGQIRLYERWAEGGVGLSGTWKAV